MYFVCCICGSPDRVALHHINSLRSIPEKDRNKFDYLRNKLNRLQIPVCHECHRDITYGRYDNDKTPRKFFDEFIAKL